MLTYPKIPKGWRQLRNGTVIKKGDRFVNSEGLWMETSDYGRKVKRGYPVFVFCGTEIPSIYIRRNRDTPKRPVFTVGSEQAYDNNLKYLGAKFRKLGRSLDYPGGYALRSVADARRLIKEQGPGCDWAVYELDADWDVDTVPSKNGWWRALIWSRQIIRKVPARKRHVQLHP